MTKTFSLKMKAAAMIFLAVTGFSIAHAEPIFGPEAKELEKPILAAGKDQINYQEYLRYAQELAARGHTAEGSEVLDISAIADDSKSSASASANAKAGLKTYNFTISKTYAGIPVPKPDGKKWYRSPTIDLKGVLQATCDAQGANCQVDAKSVRFDSFEVKWNEVPPVGGSMSSSGGRE